MVVGMASLYFCIYHIFQCDLSSKSRVFFMSIMNFTIMLWTLTFHSLLRSEITVVFSTFLGNLLLSACIFLIKNMRLYHTNVIFYCRQLLDDFLLEIVFNIIQFPLEIRYSLIHVLVILRHTIIMFWRWSFERLLFDWYYFSITFNIFDVESDKISPH